MGKSIFQNNPGELSYETIPIEVEYVPREQTTVSQEALRLAKREPVFYGNKIVSTITKLLS